MSERKGLAGLFGKESNYPIPTTTTTTSTATSQSSSPKNNDSDDDTLSDPHNLKRRSSASKLIGSLRRRNSDTGKEKDREIHKESGPDYNALMDAAVESGKYSSSTSKKLGISSTYAPKKQVKEMRLEYLREINSLNEAIGALQEQNITLSCRIDRYEREFSGIREALRVERVEREAGDREAAHASSSTSCSIFDWFT